VTLAGYTRTDPSERSPQPLASTHTCAFLRGVSCVMISAVMTINRVCTIGARAVDHAASAARAASAAPTRPHDEQIFAKR